VPEECRILNETICISSESKISKEPASAIFRVGDGSFHGELSVNQTTRHHIPERNFDINRCENLKFLIVVLQFPLILI
jgi:hypothetical protein